MTIREERDWPRKDFALPQEYFSKLMRAVVEFKLISPGDRILIGLSGGKDSLFLTQALAYLRRRLPDKFSLAALTVDPMFTADFAISPARDFCQERNIPHETIATDIAGAIKSSGKNPCFTCAYFRRATINRYAVEHGFNKIAYAHHLDDAVETFFMSLLYSGQLTVFTPQTYLDKTKLTVIRPLVYFREKDIENALAELGTEPIPSPCPFDGHTKRQRVKALIQELSAEIPELFEHLTRALRENPATVFWSAPVKRTSLQEAYFNFMKR